MHLTYLFLCDFYIGPNINIYFLFFFLIIRRPPRSTLFPNPTLFRSNGNGTNTDVFPVIVVKATDGWVAFLDTNLNGSFEDEMPLHDYRQGHLVFERAVQVGVERSEEHTSELQSQSNLVCRLLLEKKK